MQNGGPYCTATKIDIGGPSQNNNDGGWHCFQFKVHNFLSLPTTKDRGVTDSPIPFRCLGRDWNFQIYPGGKTGWPAGRVGGSWTLVSGDSIDVDYRFVYPAVEDMKRETTFNSDRSTWHVLFNFRQRILDNQETYLRGGAYTINLYIRPKGGQTVPSQSFIPKNPCSQAILKLFEEGKNGDILFEINESESENNVPTKIYAHHFILQACAPTLANLCEEFTVLTPMPINGVKPQVFRALLRYIYGGDIPSKLLKECPKDIIAVADLYGVTNLKVEAEAAYIESTPVTIDNVVDNFYFADTKKCALLKEKVMEFLVKNGQDVLNKVSFKDAPESSTMFHDFITATALATSDDKDYDGDDPTKFKTMSVNALRRKLSARGLDVDGTREMMVTALEESYAKSGEKRKREGNSDADDN